MKKLILLMIICLIPFSIAQEPNLTNTLPDYPSEEKINELNQKIESLNQQITTLITQNLSFRENLNNKINELQTKEEADTSFNQLEDYVRNKTNSLMAFLVVIIICSDVVLFGYYLLLKSRGLA